MKTIAVDIDDVLSATAEGFAAFTNKHFGGSMQASDYQEEWAKAWGVTIQEAIVRADQLHASGMFGNTDPFIEALPVLLALKERYRLILITSRQTRLKPETMAWLDRHFPGVFSDIHFMGIWERYDHTNAEERAKITKAEMCKQLGADYLIDDQLKHCLGAAEAGVPSLLFGEYGWNKADQLPDGVTRVRDWGEIEEYFDAQS